MAISDELDLQNNFLDEVDETVSRVGTRLNVSDKKVKKLLKH
jgi:hypothetical protein